jgi:bifunctional non-homologous end joining protein LigD
VFAGNVGSGLDDATIASLLPQLEATEQDAPAFGRAPEPKPSRTHYVVPEWVAEVRYTEVTSKGNLRHPVLVGLHHDVELTQCVAPVDREAEIEAAPAPEALQEVEVKISRREKIFWPEEGYTKGDLLDYYEAIWPWIAPYLQDRPLVLTRYPDGIEGKSFFQQNAPDWTPAWALREAIDGTDFFICNEKRTLLHVINSGAIPLHVWHSRRTNIDRPDWITLDLDPKSAPFRDVVTVARHIHKLLDELEAVHFVKTSGQAGLHILIPIGGLLGHHDARSLAEVLARVVVHDLPEIATITRPVAARGDKVYVDFGQNGRGRLIASPFSVRPKPGAPVSTPLTWGQVTNRLDPRKWNIRTTPRRMKQSGDPLAGLLEEQADVGALLDALVARLG